MSNASNLGNDLVRPKKKRARQLSTFDRVNMAAERQMQRVMAKSPLQINSITTVQQSPNNTSNQTVITSHKSSQEDFSNPRIAAETPPVSAVSPATSKEVGWASNPNAQKAVPVTIDKRKSMPVKRQQPSVTVAAQVAKQNTPSSQTRKRTRLNFTNEYSRSPKQALSLESSSHSRDRSNSSRSGKASKKSAPDNQKIDQFFTAVKKNMNAQEGINASTSHLNRQGESSAEVEALRARCHELEKSCRDMDGQLKAVSNNQTIMHTSLKAALSRREQELEEMKKSHTMETTKRRNIIETLVRNNSARESKELRQKLASDGARLGRIIYTRAGLRSVESWEEGHASKLLQRRHTELEAKKRSLHAKQEKMDKSAVEANNVDLSMESTVLSDALSLIEAKESLRYHLDSVRRQEIELRDEQNALCEEKNEHIRALKLVASEDASRFRSRPKLNDRYVLLSLLGKGGFSEVWRAYDLDELREVAVKIHQLDSRWSESKKDNYTKHVSREYEIHRGVRHPRIVSLYDVFEIDNNSFATVLECCKGTDLDTLLKERRILPERDARAILLQILSGMNYLSHPSGSRQGIIHYDLKPGNILFDESGNAKITDFGLSKIIDAPDAAESMELTSQGAGTYWYLPPECFITDQTVRISNKVDVWSIGVIYYQMLFGKRPFGDGMSQDCVLTNNTMLDARSVHFPDGTMVSAECKNFIRLCLTYDQVLRPTVAQICRDHYVWKTQL